MILPRHAGCINEIHFNAGKVEKTSKLHRGSSAPAHSVRAEISWYHALRESKRPGSERACPCRRARPLRGKNRTIGTFALVNTGKIWQPGLPSCPFSQDSLFSQNRG